MGAGASASKNDQWDSTSDAIYDDLDKDGSGKLSGSELIKGMEAIEKERYMDYFGKLDLNIAGLDDDGWTKGMADKRELYWSVNTDGERGISKEEFRVLFYNILTDQVGPAKKTIVESQSEPAVTTAGKWWQVALDNSVVVTRKEIRGMSAGEQTRYCDAVTKMMEGTPGNSQFFRIAAYHDKHCAHGEETFPGWHRAYLLDFERTMRRADIANGNDGNIGLPFWDWTREKINGEVYPQCVRDRFPNFGSDHNGKKLPVGDSDYFSGFPAFANVTKGTEYEKVRYRIYDDVKILKKTQRYGVFDSAYDCLDTDEHWKAASTRNGRSVSVENSHNSIHMSTGDPLTAVPIAGFHPAFYLHHCNVDRIYESYLREQGNKQYPECVEESREEFEATQRALTQPNKMNSWRPEEDRYQKWLEPFYLPEGETFDKEAGKFTGPNKFHSKDTFLTENTGFKYEDTLKKRPPQMRQLPTYALYVCDVRDLKKKSYELHTFVVGKDSADSWTPPLVDGDTMDWDEKNDDGTLKHPSYCGLGAVFGGKDTSDCKNCSTRKPFLVRVDVTPAMTRQNLTRDNAVLKCYAISQKEGEDPEGCDIADIDGLSAPTLVGPLFENKEEMTEGATGHNARALQRYLKKFGYLGENCLLDASFGPKTLAAFKAFQEANGLKVDGIVGAQSFGKLQASRLDGDKDVHSNPNSIPKYAAGSTVKWWVEVGTPTYLSKQGSVKDEVAACFEQWSDAFDATVLKFEEANSKEDANLCIRWALNPGAGSLAEQAQNTQKGDDSALDGNLLVFDGPGGELARACTRDEEGKDDVQCILFDRHERWRLQGTAEEAGKFQPSFREVCVHEIGHCLGIQHSSDPSHTMAPYYVPGRITLSDGDKALAKKLYA